MIGPLVSQVQLDRVTSYIESGRQEGATVMVGGGRKEGPGWFVEPTVLVDTEASMKVRREEIFGPVLCAHRFTSEEDADRLARLGNETEYGLAATIWTRDIGMAHRLARRLKSGTIRINGAGGVDPALPLGGYKASGWGARTARRGSRRIPSSRRCRWNAATRAWPLRILGSPAACAPVRSTGRC
jgi:phenylacetaldehyde dehydrogenase